MGIFGATKKDLPSKEREILSLGIEVIEFTAGQYSIEGGFSGGKADTLMAGYSELGVPGRFIEYCLGGGDTCKVDELVNFSFSSGPRSLKRLGNGTFGEVLFRTSLFVSPSIILMVGQKVLKDLIEEIRWRKPASIRITAERSEDNESAKPKDRAMLFDIFKISFLQYPL